MDKLVVHLDLLYLRLEMTVASFVIVQALSMCCRIQFCMIHGGVPAIFSVLKSSELKFPALERFVLPTDIHVSRGTRLGERGAVEKVGKTGFEK